MTYELELQCHPTTPCAAVERIGVSIVYAPANTLVLRYSVTGAIAHLRLPAPRKPQQVDELWRHTCCELFIAAPANAAYYEFNFSPSSEWAAYEFHAYRQGMCALSAITAPCITTVMTATELQVNVELAMDVLPATWRAADLKLALSMVIEDTAGHISYWALKHPPGKPDFHHADGFALTNLGQRNIDVVWY